MFVFDNPKDQESKELQERLANADDALVVGEVTGLEGIELIDEIVDKMNTCLKTQ